MLQVVQDLKQGKTRLEEVPVPVVRPGHLLIRARYSLVSAGTERMLVEFGKAGWLSRIRQQPEKVQMVLDKIKAEGLRPTLEAVFAKLGQPMPLGYCHVGVVEEVGEGVRGFSVGDRVVSNGPHAEWVCVPENLAARIPEGVDDKDAAFTVLGAIGLQGIRLLNPTLGETFCVMGLGLIGLLTAELLLANGCRVIGVDPEPERLKLAEAMGVIPFRAGSGEDVLAFAERHSSPFATAQGHRDAGVDGVIITASAKNDEIVHQSAQMCRKRGRIVLVGVVDLNLRRSDFYEKELSFQVSCSYGPGRYDEDYELRGHDYPLPYVRWTEKRNFEAVLQMMQAGKLNPAPLVSQIVPFGKCEQVYERISDRKVLASLLEYSSEPAPAQHSLRLKANYIAPPGGACAVVGAGNFSSRVILPLLKKAGMPVKHLISAAGLSGTHLAKKFDIPFSGTDYEAVLQDPEVKLVVVATRHHLHAPMAAAALRAGKHVFVEKPPAIRLEEVEMLEKLLQESPSALMVGYNRRFAPLVQKMKELLPAASPKTMVAVMNAGYIPPDSWVHDMEQGGGRIVGEACHLMDLLQYLSGSLIAEVHIDRLGRHPAPNTDSASISLKFANGDIGSVHYFSTGSKAYSKERVEVHSEGKTLILDNFRKLHGYGFKGFRSASSRLDKGHAEQFRRLTEFLLKGGEPLMSAEEIFAVSRASFGGKT